MAIEKLFYSYLWRDPRPGKNMAPFWVGKGRGRRAFRDPLRGKAAKQNPLLQNVVRKILETGLLYQVEIVAYFKTETEAFVSEMELIGKYGRRYSGTGILCNLTDGGEGASGRSQSDAEKEAARLRIKRRWDEMDAEHQAIEIDRLRKLNTDPVLLAEKSVRAKEQHANDPKFCVFSDPDFVKAHTEKMLQLWSDPEYRNGSGAKQLLALRDPENLKRAAQKTHERQLVDPAFRKKIADAKRVAMQERWKDPEYRARRKAGLDRWRERGLDRWGKRRRQAQAMESDECLGV